MIEIDGSWGEGGGQLVRTSIALSAATEKPTHIYNIRAKRPNPGLAAQHLTAIKTVAQLTNAHTEGVSVGSKDVVFKPKKPQTPEINVDIGTAGSITLLLQALMPAAAFAPDIVRTKIIGGTDVRWSPPIDYLVNVTLPILQKMGYRAEIDVVRRGHYPRGGGVVKAEISPVKKLEALKLIEFGEIEEIRGISHCVRLPSHVAVRQARAAGKKLDDAGYGAEIDLEYYPRGRDLHRGPGSGVVLWGKTSSGAVLGGSALGERGKPAEQVGVEAAENLIGQFEAGATVDKYLADQIVPFLSLAKGESVVKAPEFTMHTKTNIWVVNKFLDAEFNVTEEKEYVEIRCNGIG